MAYATRQARQELLDTVAEAADALGFALAALTDAYERLDDHNAEKLEEALFQPVQAAYGRAKRTHAEFADRHGLPGRTFERASAGVAASGARGMVESAVEAAGEADRALAALQDSMLPVEAGDEELRSGLAAIRDSVGGMPDRARELIRTLGR
jgi:hypothetical protein